MTPDRISRLVEIVREEAECTREYGLPPHFGPDADSQAAADEMLSLAAELEAMTQPKEEAQMKDLSGEAPRESLDDMLKKATEAVETMTPYERAVMHDDQQRSWVYGETGRWPAVNPFRARIATLERELAEQSEARRREHALRVKLAGDVEGLCRAQDVLMSDLAEAEKRAETGKQLLIEDFHHAHRWKARAESAEREAIERCIAVCENVANTQRHLDPFLAIVACCAAIRSLLPSPTQPEAKE